MRYKPIGSTIKAPVPSRSSIVVPCAQTISITTDSTPSKSPIKRCCSITCERVFDLLRLRSYFFYSNIRIFTCTFISFVRKILKKIVYLSFKFIFQFFPETTKFLNPSAFHVKLGIGN